MQPLQRALLLLLLALLFLCMALGQVDKELGITPHTPLNPSAKSLSPPGGTAALLCLTLGLAAAFFLRLH